MYRKPAKPFYYLFCNHWTQGGIGYAFPSGWMGGRKYNRTFSTVYTIHKMLDAADAYPGLKVSLELDAHAYEEVQKEDPSCIERLRRYIAEGKAGIDGGTYGQPFGQDYGWEPNVRHLTYGRKAIRDVLGYDVRAFLVEEQWFHPQLPQLLLKSGFRYASLQNQNSGQVKPMNESMILWRGADGSRIPAIPANDLQVSCVRQYTDYSVYADLLDEYDRPLLFQWVEIWPPGMDWGASAAPFEKAIRQVLEWGGVPVTLSEYFEREAAHRELAEVYIPLDESNYANNWYQGGGWGYDGDKVILQDKRAEKALLALESAACWASLAARWDVPKQMLDGLWKKLLVLQNHDFSVARSYRAVTEEGLVTNAGSLAAAEYGKLIRACERAAHGAVQALVRGGNGEAEASDADPSAESWTIVNPYGYTIRKTVELEFGKAASHVIREDGLRIPLQPASRGGDANKGRITVELPPLSATVFTAAAGEMRIAQAGPAVRTEEHAIEDDDFRIEWVPGTWHVRIADKRAGTEYRFTGFTGPIAKVNEHDANQYPALSPAHETFSFAFDGKTHAPDQISRIRAAVEESGPVRSTLLLRSDLLTLHTTDTPAAFAEVRVSLDHGSGRIECESFLYAGVYLSLQCWAEFSHNLKDSRCFRDYPFGEEETFISDIYPNSYIRVVSKENGFTLIHSGTQRVRLERNAGGGVIRHLLARDKVLGEYTWNFALYPGRREPWESAVLAQSESAVLLFAKRGRALPSRLKVSHPCILLSAFRREGDDFILRFVNYSGQKQSDVDITVGFFAASAAEADLSGEICGDALTIHAADGETVIKAQFSPWEIKTIRCFTKTDH